MNRDDPTTPDPGDAEEHEGWFDRFADETTDEEGAVEQDEAVEQFADPGWIFHDPGRDGTGSPGWFYLYADGVLFAEDGTPHEYDAAGGVVPAADQAPPEGPALMDPGPDVDTAPESGQTGDSSSPNAEPPPAGSVPASPPGRSNGRADGRADVRVRLLALAAAVLALAVVLGLVITQPWFGPAQQPSAGSATDATGFDPPNAVPPDSEYVRSRMLPSGRIEVDHWIRSTHSISELTLRVPIASGESTKVTPRDVRVRGESGTQTRLDADGPTKMHYTFADTSTLHVSYVLSGAVQRRAGSDRALAAVTSLDLAYSHGDLPKTVLLLGGRLLAAACTVQGSETEPRPCGSSEGAGWRVRLEAPERHDVVLAQLDLARREPGA